MDEGERRADDLIAAAPPRSWQKISAVDARPGLAVRNPGPGGKRGIGADDPGMIGNTLAEIRRLLAKIAPQQPAGPDHAWSWSRWRRKRQYQARICRYRRRGYALE